MAPSQRRSSIDPSSSSSSGPSPGIHDHQSHPHDKKTPSEPAQGGNPSPRATSGDAQPAIPNAHGGHQPESPSSYMPSTSTMTTLVPQQQPQIPPSGYRIPLIEPGPFPGVERTGAAPFRDVSSGPVFIGSALLQYSVHPCKISSTNDHVCLVGYRGKEVQFRGRYDLLPFVPEHMEFVQTSRGRIPPGRRPIKGGFEQDGPELYHAVATLHGIKVPGKTGIHLVRTPGFLWTLSVCGSRAHESCLARRAATSLSIKRSMYSRTNMKSCKTRFTLSLAVTYHYPEMLEILDFPSLQPHGRLTMHNMMRYIIHQRGSDPAAALRKDCSLTWRGVTMCVQWTNLSQCISPRGVAQAEHER